MTALAPSRAPARSGIVGSIDFAIRPRRLAALATSETRLLLRNRALVLYTLALPVLLAAPMTLSLRTGGRISAPELGAQLMVQIACFSLGFGVFFALVSTLVARRQDLVLKRLRASELSAAEILGGSLVPMWLTFLVQVALGIAISVALFDLGAPTQPLPLALAIVGGGVMVALLAAGTSGLTRTTEAAQVTTLPLMCLMLLSPGVVIPAGLLPDRIEQVAGFLPLAPVAELLQRGFAPGASFADQLAGAGKPAAVLLVWCLIGVWFATKAFRWEPRR